MSVEQLVSNITSNFETQNLLQAYGLKAHSVTWEDTARDKNSCVGPNISDMTLIVKNNRMLMPIIRKPNFSDVTHDTPIDTYHLRVGNESEQTPQKIVTLKEYLTNLNTYCPDVKENLNLYLDRDEHILTSTQCCVLPDKAEFAVQLFNYQSYDEDPAVLVILASKDGTSTQVLTHSNQKLFFNSKGTSRWFSVDRLESTRQNSSKTRVDSYKEMTQEEKLNNTLMVFQVPLKVTRRPVADCVMLSTNCLESCSAPIMRSKNKKGMDMGQISLGSSEGPFIGTKGLKLVRDERFPIRCTFQYYRVTDENHISEANVKDIAEQLNEVSKVSLSNSSLVLNNDTKRKTEPTLNSPPVPPNSPWQQFTMSGF